MVDTLHSDILDRFRTMIQKGRLAHAYLFTGPRGIGKSETALAVARLINCVNDGAEDCSCTSCLKTRRGNHPDVFFLEKPEDKTEILIGQMISRSNNEYDPILPKLYLRPMEGRKRVLIVREAQQMNAAAANSFLKTLEEPPEATVIILTSSSPGDFLSTIISRCHEVRFFSSSNASLATRLKNEYDVPPVEADILAKFSAGSPGKAMELRDGFLLEKNTILNEFVLSAANEQILKKYASDKDRVRTLCEVLLAFFRDIWLWKNGVAPEALFNRDRLVDVRRQAEKYDLDTVRGIVEQVVVVRRAADENFNVKIALTVLKEMIS